MLPTVALIGPPNAGKSTLFNAVVGQRKAITSDIPGTTRDRAYAPVSWQSKNFMLVDTAGLALKSDDPLERNITQQTNIAIAEADLIVFVADGKAPAQAAKNSVQELRKTLRENKIKNEIKVVLAINKIDSPKNRELKIDEFKKLGISEAITVSAITGRGTGDLLDIVTNHLPAIEQKEQEKVFTTVAIVGRPNVGKSTLLNHLLGKERSIVSDIPGTTRNVVEEKIVHKGKDILLVDTAGMKRRARIKLNMDEYALFQSIKGLQAANIAILMLDSSTVISRYEKTIAGKIKESAKGVIIAVNKVDLFPESRDPEQIEGFIKEEFPFLSFAKVIPISAQKGINITQLLDAVLEVQEERNKEITANILSKQLKKWLEKHPPMRLRAQKKPYIYDLKQEKTDPPTFALVVNDPKAIHYSYVRFIENKIREKFGFLGTAVRIKKRIPRKKKQEARNK